MEAYQIQDKATPSMKSFVASTGNLWFSYEAYGYNYSYARLYAHLKNSPGTTKHIYSISLIEVGAGSEITFPRSLTLSFDKNNTTQQIHYSMKNPLNYVITVTNKTPPEALPSPYNYLPNVNGLSEDFGKLFKDEDAKDVTFIVEMKEIKAHKFVLAARSPVFKKMFEIDMQEKSSSEIKITDVEFETLVAFLEYVYSDKFTSKVNNGVMLYLADKYDLEGLKVQAANSILRNMNSNNAVTVLILFDRYRVPKLKGEVVKYIAMHKNLALAKDKKKELKKYSSLLELVDMACGMYENVEGDSDN